jgi:hypothetical protein
MADREPNDGQQQPPPTGRPNGDEQRKQPHDDAGEKGSTAGGIQWFTTLSDGLNESQRTGRPVLLLTAAPHCAGISGMW